jgi:hypothetical protein
MAKGISGIFSDIVTDFDYLVFGLIFVAYIMLNSQIFIERVLDKFAGAVSIGQATNYGIIIQGLFMAGIAVILYSLYLHEII